MNKEEKGIELIETINREWYVELEKDKLPEIVMYKPFTDEYWNENYKIVFCNLEPGQKLENRNFLDLPCFIHWLENKNPTIKKSALFIHCLYNELHGTSIDKSQLDIIKNDNNLLIDTMKKVTYMNLLRDANEKFDEKFFWKFFKLNENEQGGNIHREYTKKFINALSPDIFIVTAEAGKNLTEELFNKKFDNNEQTFIDDNILFLSLMHPRCGPFNDGYILNWSKKASKKLQKIRGELL